MKSSSKLSIFIFVSCRFALLSCCRTIAARPTFQKKPRVEGYILRATMKGDPKVISYLNEVLKAELTAINQYFLHAKMCETWGYFRLADYNRKESIEEMVHAEKLMTRILFLEGTPNMTEIGPIKVGKNVRAQLESDLALELDALPRLNAAIKYATEV